MQTCAISLPNSAFDIRQPVTMSESSSARTANGSEANIAAIRTVLIMCIISRRAGAHQRPALQFTKVYPALVIIPGYAFAGGNALVLYGRLEHHAVGQFIDHAA